MKKQDAYQQFESLPAGVWPIRDYPSLGATLCECEHAEEHRVLVKNPLFGHDVMVCRVCKASFLATERFTKPVKLLAVVPNVGQLALS